MRQCSLRDCSRHTSNYNIHNTNEKNNVFKFYIMILYLLTTDSSHIAHRFFDYSASLTQVPKCYFWIIADQQQVFSG